MVNRACFLLFLLPRFLAHCTEAPPIITAENPKSSTKPVVLFFTAVEGRRQRGTIFYHHAGLGIRSLLAQMNSVNLVCNKCIGKGYFNTHENPCGTCRGQRVLGSPGKGNVICPKCSGNGVRLVKVQCDCCTGRGSHASGPCKFHC